MVTIVKALKEMKININELKENRKKQDDDDIKEILENKKLIEEILENHTEVISRMEDEIKRMETEKCKADVVRIDADTKDEASGEVEKVKKIKCRYFNKGFCKYRKKCRYLHRKNICSDYVTNAKCLQTTCEDRHPEMCKFWGSTS